MQGKAHAYSVKMTKESINELPLSYYEGIVHVLRSPEEQEDACAFLAGETVIGFDTETRPAFRKGITHLPSLVQLAGHDRVFLFHLEWMPVSRGLTALFENPAITKCGVAVRDDLLALQKLHPFCEQGFIDLLDAAKTHGIGNCGLRGLAAQFLQIRISKGERCSNWSNKELSSRQVRYAATDAWASREIYLAMQGEGFLR